ncbi:SGNH/GDSL hydrolase family protein [Pseudomonas piscis]|uniref:SGNH/GDSL hydrolase family protein n=1 Tax=Pseudomonas piscis TaxID=2614538 RepID=A0A7X1U4Q3_9PSED|nr:SGNH/GDSL hydrolase family protein [Pseudomonas piscis]MQA54404.1 SGNH/GDSL hydrolase family protein [Pseudomonas piscis]
MIESLSRIVLGPLLLAQGLYVRRFTPRLPEPQGPRAGSCGQGPSLRLLVVGDSAAAGVGVSHQDDALAGQLATCLARDFSLSWQLLAEAGLDTRQLLRRIEDSPGQGFDAVLVCVGVNDVTSAITAEAWLACLATLVQRLRQRFRVHQVLLSRLPPMHAFIALPQPLRWYLGSRARHFNRLLEQWSRDQPQVTLLGDSLPLDASLLAADGFHPGAPAYRIWAEQSATLLRKRFAAPVGA